MISPLHPWDLTRIVVGVDPAVTSGEDADSTGIVVAALGRDGDGYVLDDRTCRDTPQRWAQRVMWTYDRWQADRVVAEKNQGGDLVATVLRAQRRNVPLTLVHASRGKLARAEPIAALYEQGRVHHVGVFPELEEELTSAVPGSGPSPDRMDALVWALTELMGAADTGGSLAASDDGFMAGVKRASRWLF